MAAADDKFYQDAWGAFYSAYSPVFDSDGEVAGVIAVDFDAAWYNEQLAVLYRTTIIVALLSLLVSGAIVTTIITRSQQRIKSIHGQLNELETVLMQEMGSSPPFEEPNSWELIDSGKSLECELYFPVKADSPVTLQVLNPDGEDTVMAEIQYEP